MIRGLQQFLGRLRAASIEVSPAEWIEALRAVEAVGPDRREGVRFALAATLIKQREHRATFDRLFDEYFRSTVPQAVEGKRKKRRRGVHGLEGGQESKTAPRREPAASAAGAARTTPPEDRDPEQRTREEAATLLRQLRRGEPHTERRVGALRRIVRAERPSEKAPGARRAPRPPLRERLSYEQEAAWVAQLPRLLARLRSRQSRRWRGARRGPLHPRRLFRQCAGQDGVPWLLPRRRTRRKPSRVLLLLDASWSVARAAGLFLSIAAALLERRRDIGVWLFVDRPVDATRTVRHWLAQRPGGQADLPTSRAVPGAAILRGGRSFATLLQQLPDFNANAASDYGRALHGLAAARGLRLGRETLLVVLGDGRNNRFDPQAWNLETLQERCGGVLWIVPEPIHLWGTGDSALADYAPHCDCLVEADDARGLCRGVVEMERRLR